MKGRMDTEMGKLIIDRDVLAKYAGMATTDCIGIIGMAAVNVKDGVTKLLKRENVARGVSIYVNGDRIKIELHVIVAYGVNIRVVAQNVLESVRYICLEESLRTLQSVALFCFYTKGKITMPGIQQQTVVKKLQIECLSELFRRQEMAVLQLILRGQVTMYAKLFQDPY